MSKKKILMLVGDYAEDYETMVPFPGIANDWPPGGCSVP